MREFKDLKIAVAGTGYVGLSMYLCQMDLEKRLFKKKNQMIRIFLPFFIVALY